MANKSRDKGHNYERKIRKEFQELGFENCQTSRYASREKDDQKVDLVNTRPFNIQCKAVETGINYHDLLNEMPKDSNINCVFHKRSRKETVTMSKKDFYKLIDKLFNKQNNYKQLKIKNYE